MISLFRLDGIATTTGEPRWSTKDWSAVIGELTDGALVVVGDAEAGRPNLRVGVLERASGAVRFACEAPAGLGSLATGGWSAADGGLRTELTVPQRVTGTQRYLDATVSQIQLTLSSASCALSRPLGGTGTELPPPHMWRTGGLEIEDLQYAAIPTTVGDVLVARRDGHVVWRRTAAVDDQQICDVP